MVVVVKVYPRHRLTGVNCDGAGLESVRIVVIDTDLGRARRRGSRRSHIVIISTPATIVPIVMIVAVVVIVIVASDNTGGE
jgi:hypothetical protein